MARRAATLQQFLIPKLGNIQVAAYIARSEVDLLKEDAKRNLAVEHASPDLAKAQQWLNPADVAMHIEFLYVLGDDAHEYAAVLALAGARYKDLLALTEPSFFRSGNATYLDYLSSDLERLYERTRLLISHLAKQSQKS